MASSSCTYHTLDESRHPPCFLQEDGLKAMINTGIRKSRLCWTRNNTISPLPQLTESKFRLMLVPFKIELRHRGVNI